MLTKCERCGHENRLTAKFCANCGNTLNETLDQQPEETATNEPVEPPLEPAIDSVLAPTTAVTAADDIATLPGVPGDEVQRSAAQQDTL